MKVETEVEKWLHWWTMDTYLVLSSFPFLDILRFKLSQQSVNCSILKA